MRMPMAVDGADNAVASTYGGWPDRLYLIRPDGTIAYQGDDGPFGFKPDELEQAIELSSRAPEPPTAGSARATRGSRQDDLWHLPSVGEERSALRAGEDTAQPHHELAAREALEARPAREREQLLVERSREWCHELAHRRLRNTPTTLPSTLTWSA